MMKKEREINNIKVKLLTSFGVFILTIGLIGTVLVPTIEAEVVALEKPKKGRV